MSVTYQHSVLRLRPESFADGQTVERILVCRCIAGRRRRWPTAARTGRDLALGNGRPGIG